MADKTHIRTLKLQGFKSFRSAEIAFPEGFTCLAGPNGSGKSNIVDAIRFVLGESSLKALRGKRVSDLTNSNCKFAQVTLSTGGAQHLEIQRAINREGKLHYGLNGKRTSRTRVIERIQKCGIGASGIINQLQVQKIVEMEPAERRRIIDGLAGAAEFDTKFDEARLELCRLEREISDVNIIFGARKGFLKELNTLNGNSAYANRKLAALCKRKEQNIGEIKARIASLKSSQKSAIEGMEESEARKRAAFLSTFNTVDENFRKLSADLFHGNARLVLEQPADPFKGGLSVELCTNGSSRRLEYMSGGEKALLVLILIFAIQMHKKAPFYVLDEADATLDKENSVKFAALLKRLSKGVQFIAITHNDTVLSAADAVLGVVRTDNGSKIVGMKKSG